MSQFQIFTPAETENLRRAGKILHDCLRHTAAHVKAGITTGELDDIARAFILSHPGAKPGFTGYNGYPKTLCISVNEESVHGIPGARILKDGDIVSLDGGVMVGGLHTDACITVPVGSIPPKVQDFLSATERALSNALNILKAGTRIGDLSATIQETVEAAGYHCIPSLTGHGLGKTLHQFPDIPNVGKRGTGPIIPAGTMLAIEPITSMGGSQINEAADGWTLSSRDGALTAHVEHTVLVWEEGCEILT